MTKMSEPTRYEPIDDIEDGGREISEMVEREDGTYCLFADYEAAVDAERERVKSFGKYRTTKAGLAICPFLVWQSENIGYLDKSPKENDVSLVFCDHPNNPDKYEGNCNKNMCPLAVVDAEHDITCNHRNQPIGGPGCACIVKNKYVDKQDRVNAIAAERTRCREHEVGPLMGFIEYYQNVIFFDLANKATQEQFLRKAKVVRVAVKKLQGELP